MTLKIMKSNLNIKSNVYVMPENFSVCHLFAVTEKHKEFIQRIEDKVIFEKLDAKLKQYGSEFQKDGFGLCSGHRISYGQLKINGQIVYGCRCNRKDICKNREIVRKREFMRTGKKFDCESCPRFKG